MGAFVNSLLNSDEHVIYETKLSLFGFISWMLSAMAFAICFFIVYGFAKLPPDLPAWLIPPAFTLAILFTVAYPFLIRKFDEFAVTNQRVIVKTGIITRNIFEMRLSKIESVDLSQNLLERMFSCGSVTIRGTGDTAKRIRMIEHPFEFRQAINNACASLPH